MIKGICCIDDPHDVIRPGAVIPGRQALVPLNGNAIDNQITLAVAGVVLSHADGVVQEILYVAGTGNDYFQVSKIPGITAL